MAEDRWKHWEKPHSATEKASTATATSKQVTRIAIMSDQIQTRSGRQRTLASFQYGRVTEDVTSWRELRLWWYVGGTTATRGGIGANKGADMRAHRARTCDMETATLTATHTALAAGCIATGSASPYAMQNRSKGSAARRETARNSCCRPMLRAPSRRIAEDDEAAVRCAVTRDMHGEASPPSLGVHGEAHGDKGVGVSVESPRSLSEKSDVGGSCACE